MVPSERILSVRTSYICRSSKYRYCTTADGLLWLAFSSTTKRGVSHTNAKAGAKKSRTEPHQTKNHGRSLEYVSSAY